MFQLDEPGRRIFLRAMSGEAQWTVAENCPIIVNTQTETRVVGQGWVVCTPIRGTRGPIGMLYSDAGLTDAVVEPERQAKAAVLCTVLGLRLESLRGSGKVTYGPSTRHPAVAAAVHMLTDDPSLRGVDIAKKIGVSLSRFARVFKSDMGMSLVDFRNQLRLERFLSLVDAGGGNLLEAAYAAGFGSYSQFHRVFRALRGASPRDYFSGSG
jgi:AraC-like DNA-binding protein